MQNELDDLAAGDQALDLAFDPRASTTSSPSSISVPPVVVSTGPAAAARAALPSVAPSDEPPAEEVARVAGVTRPTSWALAPLYAWKALRRLPVLRADSAARVEEADRAERVRRESFAAWARDHGRQMAAEPALKPFIDAALRSNQELQGYQRGREADFEHFRQQDGALADELRAAEAERARLTGELGTKEAAHRACSDAVARVRAKLRRVDIELRNLERLAQGKLGEGSPHQAKAVELTQARAAAAGETAEAESGEARAKQEADGVRSQLAAIDRRVEERKQAARNDPARRRVEEELDRLRRQLEEAMSAAAAQALSRRLVDPESPDAQRLRALEAAAEGARRTMRVHQAALAGIDKTMIAVGLAVPAGLLLVLFVLLALLR